MAAIAEIPFLVEDFTSFSGALGLMTHSGQFFLARGWRSGSGLSMGCLDITTVIGSILRSSLENAQGERVHCTYSI
jgi:hypothetical protein